MRPGSLRIRSLVVLTLCSPLMAQRDVPLRSDWEIAPERVANERPAPSAWRETSVPGTFEDVFGVEFDGTAWYRRRVAWPRTRNSSRGYRVTFRAAATAATVFWNGREVGRHLGGWTPFTVALDAEADGSLDGLLEARVDERVGHATQGFLPVIQPHFGGLWQDVVLHVDEASATIDESRLLTFGDGATGSLRCRVPVRSARSDQPLDVVVTLSDGSRVVARARERVPARPVADSFFTPVDLAAQAREARVDVGVRSPRPWAPGQPHLYRVEIELRSGGDDTRLDRTTRRVGFRSVGRRGTTLLWNGEPLQVRGMLHWGYAPPGFAPSTDATRWRRELEHVRALGCNLVKCCLWVPPRSYLDVADELGVLVWQEYPTWHAKLTNDQLPMLAAEFDELFAHDRSHASVAFRSITCETGADVDAAVLRSLYDAVHAAVPNTLAIDNSSWISWMRVHDFWDDHPYGNNGWWPGKLEELRAFIAAREPQPLLLGECIASDTWFDADAWAAAGRDEATWFAPWCLRAQRGFEAELIERWGSTAVDALAPTARAYAFTNRKYQVERLRLSIPDAGYVLSVIRDFPKARMGFLDDFDRPKWDVADWSWHRDTMLCLDTADDRRAFVGGRVELPVRVSHFGRAPVRGELVVRLDDGSTRSTTRGRIEVAAGTVASGCTLRVDAGTTPRPRRARVEAELHDGTRRLAHNAWDVWLHPAPTNAKPPAAVRVVRTLDGSTLDHVESGGAAVLLAGPQKHSLKTSNLWFLRGAPFTPPAHPLFERVPAALLSELHGFDLEQANVLHGDALFDETTPILAFWDTHDIREVRRWLLLAETRVGAGRLIVSALNHDSVVGRWLLDELVRHAADGPPPVRELTPATRQALRGALSGVEVDLTTWRFRTDPGDVGLAAGWADGRAARGADWRDMPAARHWEAEGVQHDGVAWYATTLEVPRAWRDRPVHAVFEGVDDSYRLYVNGREVARHGDPATGETVWLVRTAADLTGALDYGATNRLVLRVVDHTGAGGLHRRAFVTTAGAAAVGQSIPLLN